MASKRPIWPPRSSDFPPLVQQDENEPNENEPPIAEISDTEEPFGVDLGVRDVPRADVREVFEPQLMALEKAITTKTKVFDATLRIDPQVDPGDFNLADVLQPVEQYDKDHAQAKSWNTIALREAFQREPVQRFDDELHQASIVAWSEKIYRTLLINPIELGDLHEEPVPMTDMIFPVFVEGPQFQPCCDPSIENQMIAWEPSLYLVLKEQPATARYYIRVSVYKTHSLWRFNANTYEGTLNLYRVLYTWNEEYNKTDQWASNHGLIDRILDKDNAALGIYGMYAGGPLPRVLSHRDRRYRLTWDHPFQITAPDFGLKATAGILRYQIDYQPGAMRVGYFTSRDAVMVVTELRMTRLEYRDWNPSSMFDHKTLMKESAYVVCDGFNSFTINHCVDYLKEILPFRGIDDNTREITPIIVFAAEGVSGLNISINTERQNYRNARFFNARPLDDPIVVSWKRLQQDLDLHYNPEAQPQAGGEEGHMFPEGTPGQLEPLMAQGNFLDYTILQVPHFSYATTTLLFNLKQVPNFFPKQNRYDEYWHVYALLRQDPSDPLNNLYHYLGTISNSYFPNMRRAGHVEYNRTHFHDKLFGDELDRNQYPFVTDQEHKSIALNHRRFRGITNNSNFRRLMIEMIHLLPHQFGNPGYYTTSRALILAKLVKGKPGAPTEGSIAEMPALGYQYNPAHSTFQQYQGYEEEGQEEGYQAYQEEDQGQAGYQAYQEEDQGQAGYQAYQDPAYQATGYQDPGYQAAGYQATYYQDPGYQDPGYQTTYYQDTGYQATYYQDPGYQDPGYQATYYQDPGYQATGFQDPGYQATYYQDPAYQATGYQDPGYQATYYQDPGYQDPGYQATYYQDPGYVAPGYQAPGYQAPGYVAPGYQAPIYQDPAQQYVAEGQEGQEEGQDQETQEGYQGYQ